MQISKTVRSVMIQHLSLAAAEARKNAEMFATFQGAHSEEIIQLISQFTNEAQLLEQGIIALCAE